MIDLAFSTNAFKKSSLEQAIHVIANVGYRGVEIMADTPHAYPPDMNEDRLDDLKLQLGKRRMRVSNINAFTLFARGDTYHPTWIEPDPKQRQVRIEHTMACIQMASRLGSHTVSLQPGGPLIGSGLSRQQAGELFARGLAEVLPVARQADVVLAIEPEPGLFIESAAEYMGFKNEYFRNEPMLMMNCDIGHLYCVGEDPAEVIIAMPEQIAHIHLEDIGDNRVHQHLPPGKGAIDFQRLFAAIGRVGYSGWVTVELYPYETTAAGVAKAAWDYLSPIIANASRGK